MFNFLRVLGLAEFALPARRKAEFGGQNKSRILKKYFSIPIDPILLRPHFVLTSSCFIVIVFCPDRHPSFARECCKMWWVPQFLILFNVSVGVEQTKHCTKILSPISGAWRIERDWSWRIQSDFVPWNRHSACGWPDSTPTHPIQPKKHQISPLPGQHPRHVFFWLWWRSFCGEIKIITLIYLKPLRLLLVRAGGSN